ncbi:glycosyltransferase family 2 protein [Sphingobacterium sp. DN00404]|uniref:Glycosyltransferase family 2 protein n=1 Tax=Sphingobacterium micropteri TaxID=2763501 RepID=A0ABR7YLQ6_9SPHI|nr:glycosyltransferase family 2 protein [Sphingobacterium micropteri]MBD1432237.1 glycosyltransferase family 2 protein [Sphingobacterium micropteri]
MNKLVSIIVPVYNVEKHVEKCVRSLLEQTYPYIEYIIVDDASPDDSMHIIRNLAVAFPARKDQLKYIGHEKNKGLPAARNSGLAIAKGHYIFHCDSDDWLDPMMIADMVTELETNEADIVYTDFFLSFNRNERYMKQPECNGSDACIRSMLSGSMKFNVWNKLVKRHLYMDNNIFFPSEHCMGEDMTMIKLFCHTQKIAYIPRAYYHYTQTNPNAFTKQMSQKQLDDVRFNTDNLVAYLKTCFGNQEYWQEVNFFKLNIKLRLLISMDNNSYVLWRDWFPEANDYISINPDFSFRIKLIQYAAYYRQDWFVKLYNFLIVRFVYGVIYR